LDVYVYDLEESIVASGFPMDTGAIIDNFKKEVMATKYYLKYRNLGFNLFDEVFKIGEKIFNRAVNLGRTNSNSGHCNYLSGIGVSFNIKYTQYWSMQAQRYHFFQIVSSSSKMHRLTSMNLKELNCSEEAKLNIISQINKYNEMLFAKADKELIEEQFDKVLNDCPMGLELWMRVSTNYLQLKNMYQQRRNHRTKDWQYFCDWVEGLPYFQELCLLT
jgi:hypothetical protein